jgi:hypothetical protein
VGVDSILFLLVFQRVNSDQRNDFSVVFKRDCNLSQFSCVAGMRDRNAMLSIGIKELFFGA